MTTLQCRAYAILSVGSTLLSRQRNMQNVAPISIPPNDSYLRAAKLLMKLIILINARKI